MGFASVSSLYHQLHDQRVEDPVCACACVRVCMCVCVDGQGN